MANRPDNSCSPHFNETIFQAFEWYLPGSSGSIIQDSKSGVFKDATKSHWQSLTALLPRLKTFGITSIWIPPACKATNPRDNGYGIYDLYDLGEFSCKGSVATKWGTKAELQTLCSQSKKFGIKVIFDAVLNHKAAADGSEETQAVRVDPKKRTKELDPKPLVIESWTKFEFAAREGKYSQLKYNNTHFSGVDWDSKTRQQAIYKFVGKRADGSMKDWARDVATTENGNYDYLMFADLDFSNPEVQEDVMKWCKWVFGELPGICGMRLDAIKHYSAAFQRKLVRCLKEQAEANGADSFVVGEYWLSNSKFLSKYLDSFQGMLHLFDVKLVYNLHDISVGRVRDLRRVFFGTLTEIRPNLSVTFVANHDTQECQSLAAPVQPWFVPHAYALILLRREGTPCVFWGDVFGTAGPQPRLPACGGRLIRLVKARELFAHGEQEDYFATGVLSRMSEASARETSCIAWQRRWRHDTHGLASLVVLLSISWTWKKRRIMVGKECAGQIFTDLMGWSWSGVRIGDDGFGLFPVGPRSITVWTRRDLPGRIEVDDLVCPQDLELDHAQRRLSSQID